MAVTTFRVVEHLDVIEDIAARFLAVGRSSENSGKVGFAKLNIY